MKTKKYLSIDELINNIKNKGILIGNEDEVRTILENNNYYYIMGYKFAFKNSKNEYRKNTSFKDIYSLYIFDKLLKLIILEPILEIEQKLKTIYINNYCTRYGYKNKEILDANNYDTTNKYSNNILNTLEKQLNDFGNNNRAVLFYKNKYKFVPLWVYMKILSFGIVRDLFYISKPSDKEYITKKLTKENVSSGDIINILRLLVRIRNICCHDDILLSFVDDKLGIRNTRYHELFNLKRDVNGNIIQGKKDLFAILISIKLFISKNDFSIFIRKISNLIDAYDKEIGSLTRKQLLDIMHLPDNFDLLAEI